MAAAVGPVEPRGGTAQASARPLSVLCVKDPEARQSRNRCSGKARKLVIRGFTNRADSGRREKNAELWIVLDPTRLEHLFSLPTIAQKLDEKQKSVLTTGMIN